MELREKISEIVEIEFNNFVDYWCADQMSNSVRRICIKNIQDQILDLIKEAGYVKLADDQSLKEGENNGT